MEVQATLEYPLLVVNKDRIRGVASVVLDVEARVDRGLGCCLQAPMGLGQSHDGGLGG
jgi:hypothetical protein